MPVYNEAPTVAVVIKTVLAQPCLHELVVVDDCSTDGSWDILRDLSAKDERVKAFRHEVNQGKGAAVMTGARKAFKDGWKPAFHTTPVRDGEGYFSVFSVPMGVTANDIADQVEVFARNLHRAKCEVWVTDEVRRRAGGAPVAFDPLGTYALRGFVQDVALYRVRRA